MGESHATQQADAQKSTNEIVALPGVTGVFPTRADWILPEKALGKDGSASDGASEQNLRLRRTTATLDEIVRVATAGPWQPTQESLSRHNQYEEDGLPGGRPSWFDQAKFGIFTHWGIYTVPEWRNEWYSRNMYIKDMPEYAHQEETYGDHVHHGYKSLIPLFTAQKFNADEWLDAFAGAGARYYFPVAEHHDGFQMYRSRLSHWNSVEMGPHRDVIGELRRATLAHGLHFCTSNHRAEHWWFMSHGMEEDSDIRREAEAGQREWLAAHPGASVEDVPYRGLKHGSFYWPAMPEPENEMDMSSRPFPSDEHMQDWLMRVCELIDAYRPEMLYFDWWIGHEAFKPYVRLMAAYYYNRAAQWGIPVSICFKMNGLPWGGGTYDVERGGFQTATPFHWQTDTSIARNSWCYTDSLQYKPAGEIIRVLVNAVAHNGNLLLNVGPKADGSLAQADRSILATIGRWTHTYGEALYGTRCWKISDEGPTKAASGSFNEDAVNYTAKDFRFVSKGDAIYAFALAPATVPEDGEFVINAFKAHNADSAGFSGIVRAVTQVGAPEDSNDHRDGQGDRGNVRWEVRDDGLHIWPRLSDSDGVVRENNDILPIAFRIDEI